MRWRRLGLLLLLVVPVLGLLAWGFTRDPREITSPLVGRLAPDFSLRRLDGGNLTLADLRGKVVFLNFWASWCPPCRAEARQLEAEWQRHRSDDVVFLGVNIQDREERARAFLQQFGVSYANVIDPVSRVAVDYGVWGIPETFFIDPTGRITYKHIGAIGSETLHAKVKEARRGVVSRREGRGDYSRIQ